MKHALLVLSLVLLSAPLARALPVEEQMRFADGIYLRGLHETAVGEYLALLRDHPEGGHVPAALYRTGECYRQMGNPTGAERFYKRVAAEFPDSEQARRAQLRRAEMAIAAGRPEEAAALLEPLPQEPPDSEIAAAASYYLGLSRWKSGDRDAAVATYSRLLQVQGQSPYAAYAALDLAEIHAGEKGNDAQMTAWFEKAAAVAGTPSAKAEALFRWGEWAYRREQYQQAADILQALLVELPEEPRARDARLAAAWSLYYLERTPEALAVADQVAGTAGDAETAAAGLYLRANCLRRLNRDGEALADYQAIVSNHSTTAFAQRAAYEIMATHFKRGEYERTLVAAPAEPDRAQAADILWMRAESERALERTELARSRYETLVQQFPKSPHAAPALLRLGELAREAGRLEEAAALFRRVAEDYPKNDAVNEALMAAALARARAGDARGALADWEALLARKLDAETAAESRMQMALAQMELKQNKEALATLEALLEEHPGGKLTARAHYWRGVLLSGKDQWAEAERALRACLAAAPDVQTAALARLRLAVALQRQDRLDEAADQIEPLLDEPARVAENPALIEWVARRRFDQGEYKRSAETARALAVHAQEASWRQIGWHWAGAALGRLGEESAAMECHEKAVAEQADTREGAESQLLLAGLELKAGRHDRAAERFAAAAEAATREEALDLRARAYFGLGETAEAAGQLDRAARHFMSVAVLFDDPEWTPHSLYRAGRLFGELGRPEQQAGIWQELRARYPDSRFVRQISQETP
ncbi:MAG TPA: tetratricopeptide repeat protein [Kiritimatiellia bacterium]|jgi:TolA-binding protein|nr:tetratricopeptide repeat protein [Lentisphaerota bacterium]HOU21930.1 tetratricopeptide repeat protein [Kiritimatiellia bacterium]